MITVGVDPGLTGAVGVLKDGNYLALFDIPTMLKGVDSKVKYEVDSAGFKRELMAILDPKEAWKAALERTSAMPGQGVASMYSMGDSYGCCRSVLACCGVMFEVVSPRVWKKHFNLTSDKEQSRALAIKLFPQADLGKKRYNDRAEALLIARYLYETQFS